MMVHKIEEIADIVFVNQASIFPGFQKQKCLLQTYSSLDRDSLCGQVMHREPLRAINRGVIIIRW